MIAGEGADAGHRPLVERQARLWMAERLRERRLLAG
jgi:hypothetical protein